MPNVDNGESKCRKEAGGQCENNDEDDGYNSFLLGEEKVITLRFHDAEISINCC